MKNRHIAPVVFLMIILAAAFLIRFVNLSALPPGLNRDEAALGYNAYSLLTTARDEHGRLLPLALESFGDWKLPLYSYLTAVFLKFLPLSELSVRLPSVVVGCLSIILVFLIAEKIFQDEKHKILIALLAAVFFAFLPWNIFFSRAAYEASVVLFIFLFAVLLFFYGLAKPVVFKLSLVLFGLTLFTHHSSHIFIPPFVFLLLWVYRKDWLAKKTNIIAVVVFCLYLLAVFWSVFLGGNKTKLSGTNLFTDEVQIYAQVILPRLSHQQQQPLTAALLHNRPAYFVLKLLDNYANFFSPQFLVQTGGKNPQHNVFNHGNLTYFDYGFLLLGVLFLVKKQAKFRHLLLFWLFLAPLPAVLTRDGPHYTRSIFITGVIPLIGAYGFISLVGAVSGIKRYFLTLAVLIFYIFGLANFVDKYFFHFSDANPQVWNYGLSETVKAAIAGQDKYDAVIGTHPERSPYIFFLFYGRYPPLKFQEEVQYYPYTSEGFLHVKSYGKYLFVPQIDWERLYSLSSLESNGKKILFFGWGEDFPNINFSSSPRNVRVIKDVYYPSGAVAYRLIEAVVPGGNTDWVIF